MAQARDNISVKSVPARLSEVRSFIRKYICYLVSRNTLNWQDS